MLALLIVVALTVTAGFIYYEKRDDLLQARFNRAVALVAEGQGAKGAEIFAAIYEGRPDSHLAPQSLYRRGEILNIGLKRYREALVAYLLLVKEYPQDGLARRGQEKVADIYKYRLQDHSQAIVAYQDLLDMGVGQGSRFQYEIADAYFKLNNFEQARIEFDSYLGAYPQGELVAEVKYRRGVCLSLEGKLMEAELQFKEVADSWPDSDDGIEAKFMLASVIEEQERLREALSIFESLKEAYPNRVALENRIVQVKERIGKKKKAI